VRFSKTRAVATEAALGGRVRQNGERVNPAKDVPRRVVSYNKERDVDQPDLQRL